MQKFATAAPVSALVDVPAGRIQVIAADRSDATVEVRPSNPGKSRDVKAAGQVAVEFTDGVLKIRAAEPKNQYFGPTGSVEVTVQVPTGSHLEATTASTEFRGVGRLGDVVFEGAYRQIKLDEATSLRLTAVDGDVEVGRLRGPAQISTARGAIRIGEATRGAVVLHTHMGDITVGAAPGASACLDAGTGHGRVSNALKNDGAAVLDIRATTGQGDITARSL
ncbi:DUF4097 family beta strand repeat-containing protein [Streptacidiphilus sp. MAP5-3]|jgi:hypothetical protein|uniref:DUF4097 family beta strand repeat-containing protein n=1 Tax=unclassified Streptacidiphilus TaxID=2643834 RepID=UPI003518A152